MIWSFCYPELLPYAPLKEDCEFQETTAIMLLMLLLILSIATYGTCQSNAAALNHGAAPSVVINNSGYTDQLIDCSSCKFQILLPLYFRLLNMPQTPQLLRLHRRVPPRILLRRRLLHQSLHLQCHPLRSIGVLL